MSLLNSPVYRSAVALNNIGVDLLERGCYGQALLTFGDTTVAMKAALRLHQRQQDDQGEESYLHEFCSMVKQANKRRHHPTRMENQLSFHMINLTDNHTSILEGQLNGSLLDRSIFPIRIDDVSHDIRSPGTLHDPDVQASIILHNNGLANLCAARAALCQDERESYQQHAIFLFELSSSILERRSEELDDELTLRHLACVNIAVLCGLLLTADVEKRKEAINHQLYRLHSAIAYLDECLVDIHAQSAAAA